MTTITVKGFIHGRPSYSWDAPQDKRTGCDFHFMTHDDMSEHGYVLVGPHEWAFEIPDAWDPRPQQVDALKAKLEKARVELSDLTMAINRQINELQAIEYTPEAIDALQTAAFAQGFDQAVEQGETVAS